MLKYHVTLKYCLIFLLNLCLAKTRVDLALTNIVLRHGELFDLDVHRSFRDLNHLHVAWKTNAGIFKVLFLPLSSSLLSELSAPAQRRRSVIHHPALGGSANRME